MPEERFVQTDSLPTEIVVAMDRAVADALRQVTANPNKSITLNFEFLVRFLPHSGETVAEFSERSQARDNKRQTAIVRNAQLELPGTLQLSEFAPDPEVTHDHIRLRRA